MPSLENIKNVLSLVIRLENLCEGFDKTSKSAVITSKIKVLFILSNNTFATPSVIQEGVGLAKSNVTILCNNLIKEGLIIKTRDTFDTREILFSLTDDGKKYLDNFLSQANKNFVSELAYKNNDSQIKQAVEDLLKLLKN